MVYVPWAKPGSTIDSRLEEFGSVAGKEALECVTSLFARHCPCHPKKSLRDPQAVTWEDCWSSKELGTRENGYLGTRDHEGASILDLLGSRLREKGMKFTDPTFPANVESLFVYPSAAGKFAGVAAGPRMDTSPFLAGKNPATIEWRRAADIYPGQKVKVSVLVCWQNSKLVVCLLPDKKF